MIYFERVGVFSEILPCAVTENFYHVFLLRFPETFSQSKSCSYCVTTRCSLGVASGQLFKTNFRQTSPQAIEKPVDLVSRKCWWAKNRWNTARFRDSNCGTHLNPSCQPKFNYLNSTEWNTEAFIFYFCGRKSEIREFPEALAWRYIVYN